MNILSDKFSAVVILVLLKVFRECTIVHAHQDYTDNEVYQNDDGL